VSERWAVLAAAAFAGPEAAPDADDTARLSAELPRVLARPMSAAQLATACIAVSALGSAWTQQSWATAARVRALEAVSACAAGLPDVHLGYQGLRLLRRVAPELGAVDRAAAHEAVLHWLASLAGMATLAHGSAVLTIVVCVEVPPRSAGALTYGLFALLADTAETLGPAPAATARHLPAARFSSPGLSAYVSDRSGSCWSCWRARWRRCVVRRCTIC
jgi:hypothetical protein